MNSSLRAANRSLLLSTILMLLFGLAFVWSLPDRSGTTVIAQAKASESAAAADPFEFDKPAARAGDRDIAGNNVASARRTTTHSSRQKPSHHAQLRNRIAANPVNSEQFTVKSRHQPSRNPPSPTPQSRHDSRAVRQDGSVGAVLDGTLEPSEPETAERSAHQFVELLPRREIQFNALSSSRREISSSRIDARLASMETKLTQLAQAQSQKPAPQTSETAQLLQQLQQSAQQLQQSAQIQNLTNELMQLKGNVAGQAGATAPVTQPGKKSVSVIKASPVKEDVIESLTINNEGIGEVLSSLGQFSGLNILSGKGIEGTVTANLQNVTVEEALDAILRSNDLYYERDGDFIFVMTSTQMEARKNIKRKLVTRVFLPHYVKAATLLSLVSPMITKEVGFIAATDANEVGISRDAESAGGDNLSQGDALVVRDYDDIIEEVAKVVKEMDVPPMQVVIEAMILSVSLTDSMEFGVNFALLNDAQSELLVSGNGATLNGTTRFPTANDQNIIPPAGEFLAATAGLKYGLIRKDVAGFIQALESIADTNLVAAPQLRVLNKQKAELIIGDRISYRTLTFNGTQTVENVNFLDVGTKLLLRPFISPDGLVRMEIHPERSSATIDQATGLPNQTTTEVTTNVMVRNGETVIIGGLIEEQISESMVKIPLLGSLPLIGPLFRNKEERINRTELIILLTPRIVDETTTALEGAEGKAAFLDRAQYFNEHVAPINRSNLVRVQRERAQLYYDRGDNKKALHFVNEALRNGKNDLRSLKLKRQIEAALSERKLKWPHWPPKNEFVESKTKNDSTHEEEFLRPTKAESK